MMKGAGEGRKELSRLGRRRVLFASSATASGAVLASPCSGAATAGRGIAGLALRRGGGAEGPVANERRIDCCAGRGAVPARARTQRMRYVGRGRSAWTSGPKT